MRGNRRLPSEKVKTRIIYLLFLLSPFFYLEQPSKAALRLCYYNKMNRKLSSLLNKLARIDQESAKKSDKSSDWSETTKIYKANMLELKNIIRKYGWPTISLVGHKASRNAWLIAQHSRHDAAFQKRCLKLLNSIYRRNPKDIDKQNIAFLTDTILVSEGKKQTFGTQFYTNRKGVFELRSTKDIKNIDERREKYGIPPLSEYLEAAKLRQKQLNKRVAK